MMPPPTEDPGARPLARPRVLVTRLNVDPRTGLCSRGCWWPRPSIAHEVYSIMLLPPHDGAAYDAWVVYALCPGDAVSAVRELYPNAEFMKRRPNVSWREKVEKAEALALSIMQERGRGKAPGGRGQRSTQRVTVGQRTVKVRG